MSLETCLKARRLDGHLQHGLKALGVNSKRVTVVRPRTVSHSIALDDALTAFDDIESSLNEAMA